MRKIKLIVKYINNNRLIEYDNIIENAISNGYNCISLRDYMQKKYETEKLLILRHDIDNKGVGASKMFEIEKKYNVRASYYFRNNTIDCTLMKKIEEYGSEASLHYETISDYILVNNIKNSEELNNTNFNVHCLNILRANLIYLRELLNIPCITIASHGAEMNNKFNIKNNYLTEDVSNYQYIGIILEAYNKEFIESLSSYISDCPLEFNNGYKYHNHPIQEIINKKSKILFLTHPEHWYCNNKKRIKKVIRIIAKGLENKDVAFKRI